MDRHLIGLVVRREINRRHGSVSAFVDHASGISRRTVERIMRGDDTIQFANLERVEGALDMPRDALSLIGAHDTAELAEIGVERDLVRWVNSQISRSDDGKTSAVS